MTSKIIQVKPSLIDNDTDRALSGVFITLLQKIRREHNTLVERFGAFDNKFYTTNKKIDNITSAVLNNIQRSIP
jgi:hypothetical protein